MSHRRHCFTLSVQDDDANAATVLQPVKVNPPRPAAASPPAACSASQQQQQPAAALYRFPEAAGSASELPHLARTITSGLGGGPSSSGAAPPPRGAPAQQTQDGGSCHSAPPPRATAQRFASHQHLLPLAGGPQDGSFHAASRPAPPADPFPGMAYSLSSNHLPYSAATAVAGTGGGGWGQRQPQYMIPEQQQPYMVPEQQQQQYMVPETALGQPPSDPRGATVMRRISSTSSIAAGLQQQQQQMMQQELQQQQQQQQPVMPGMGAGAQQQHQQPQVHHQLLMQGMAQFGVNDATAALHRISSSGSMTVAAEQASAAAMQQQQQQQPAMQQQQQPACAHYLPADAMHSRGGGGGRGGGGTLHRPASMPASMDQHHQHNHPSAAGPMPRSLAGGGQPHRQPQMPAFPTHQPTGLVPLAEVMPQISNCSMESAYYPDSRPVPPYLDSRPVPLYHDSRPVPPCYPSQPNAPSFHHSTASLQPYIPLQPYLPLQANSGFPAKLFVSSGAGAYAAGSRPLGQYPLGGSSASCGAEAEMEAADTQPPPSSATASVCGDGGDDVWVHTVVEGNNVLVTTQPPDLPDLIATHQPLHRRQQPGGAGGGISASASPPPPLPLLQFGSAGGALRICIEQLHAKLERCGLGGLHQAA